ncbi:exo-alpha-sialidase [Brachyspira pilosicoli]|uniref:exo-alpha-sialidase n=1 Tax=Brachyspira pilosicoli TaxID=52584 RepID=UPI000C7605B2|nr:exo-alpha-sialidase [Brachyspira pilosicoli]PLV63197.1 hypothetical protein BPSP16_03995 [Brachyspira pilosicoli SP16]
MSKKIIYLLSLLMALSLVFAGCKKAGTAPGDPPSNEPGKITPPTDLNGGLFTDSDKLSQYAEAPVQASPVAKYENNNYMRNPIITVLDDGKTVVVFYEIRYETPGANNDVALTGKNVVDIAYTVSTDAGVSFDTSSAITGYVGESKAGVAQNSHGAPIVFYDKKNSQIIVVASGGIGLSSGTLANGESRIDYSIAKVADLKSANPNAFSKWTTITDIKGNKGSYTQFGTHSARGTVTTDGTLLLPVTLATYDTGNMSSSKFGYLLYVGTASSGSVSWAKSGNIVNMPSGVKETRIPKGESANSYVALAVPSGDSKLYQIENGSGTPTITDIQAGDGSAGTLVVPNWQGTTSYDPSKYTTTTGGTPQSILSHVTTTEKNLSIRLVDEKFKTQQSSSYAVENKDGETAYKQYSKSSSMDILGDGTIVMIAEGGRIDTANTAMYPQTFYIYFSRYTQAYIANKTSGK